VYAYRQHRRYTLICHCIMRDSISVFPYVRNEEVVGSNPISSTKIHNIWKACIRRFGHKTSVSANQVIAAVHFKLGAPCWPRVGTPQQISSASRGCVFQLQHTRRSTQPIRCREI